MLDINNKFVNFQCWIVNVMADGFHDKKKVRNKKSKVIKKR